MTKSKAAKKANERWLQKNQDYHTKRKQKHKNYHRDYMRVKRMTREKYYLLWKRWDIDSVDIDEDLMFDNNDQRYIKRGFNNLDLFYIKWLWKN